MLIIQTINRLFPVWAILFAGLGYLIPGILVELKPLIIPLLVTVMFTMGLTLTWDDFVRALKSPRLVAIGMLLQYTVMPLVAWLLALSFGLSDELTIGLLLVSSTYVYGRSVRIEAN